MNKNKRSVVPRRQLGNIRMHRAQFGELKRWGAIVLFLFASAAIIVIASLAFDHYAGDLRDDQEASLLAIAKLKDNRIEQYLEERIGDARVFVQRTSVRTLLDPDAKAAAIDAALRSLTSAVNETTGAYGYKRLLLFNASREPVALPTLGDVSEPVSRAVALALANRKAELVDLHRNRENEVVFGIVQPAFASDAPGAELRGALYLEARAEHRLFPIVREWPVPSETAESVLFRAEGKEIVFLSTVRHSTIPPLTMRRPADDPNLFAAKALAEPPGAIRGAVDYRSHPVLGAVTRIKNTPWLLSSKIDVSEAESSLEDLRRIITGLASFLIVLSGAIVFLVWRTLNQSFNIREAELAQQYRVAVDSSLDGYLRISTDGRVLDSNGAATTISGYSKDELKAMRLDELDARLDPQALRESIELVMKTGSGRFQTRWRHKDGRIVDIDVTTVFVPDPDGGSFFAYHRDITGSIQEARRLKRLNAVHTFLTRSAEAVFGLRDPDAILTQVCKSAVADGAFLLAVGGRVDPQTGTVDVVAAEGAGADYARTLKITTDPALPTSLGPTGQAVRDMRTVVANDFRNDPRTTVWRERAAEHGLESSVATPIVVDGKAVAALMLYACEPDVFTPEVVLLIEEAARNASLAWEAGEVERQRDAEREKRSAAEERFRRIFESSPVPKQLHSAIDGRLLAINHEHEALFGYTAEDIAKSSWFDLAYPDPVVREDRRRHWLEDIARAKKSPVSIESQELRIRCRNGEERIVRGHMAVTGDDVIVTWTDLTAIRKGEAALRDSEHRFRGMVEQTVAGFYVVQDNKLTYVNSRLAEMVGWSVDELVGHDPLEFILPEDHKFTLEGRQKLAAGERSIAYSIRVRRKDGGIVIVSVHATRGLWDDRPALVAVMEDVTERTRNEERIQDAMHRLEASMRGTLEAVSKMVDLRDPYTAGHERRVGMISAAIARELGWPEDRCVNMELIGLVHDIGKIAVPAEILSKPTRLTKIEFDMIKAHAEAGYEILKDVKFDIPVAEIIRQHHERLDGRGYPRGLKGDEILPEARILAIADVLESMASHRPYRPALGIDAALEELVSHKGNLFDPVMVDAVERMVREKGYTLPV